MGRVAESPLIRNLRDLQIFRFAADQRVSTAQQTLLPDPARNSDVADLVSFFASSAADYMTGQTIIMDGGMIFS